MLRLSHAVLDTYPYGGCLTFLESIAAGKPVVTLPSDYVRGRFSYALYMQVGLGVRVEGGARARMCE